MKKEYYMSKALELAEKAYQKDEVPVGALIVKDDEIISKGYNIREESNNALWHAELVAIDKACRKLGRWNLSDCELYVTLEPCPMCAGAIIQSRIKKVYFGTTDPKGGCVGSITNLFNMKKFNHHPEFEGGLFKEESSKLLKNYFKEKRKNSL